VHSLCKSRDTTAPWGSAQPARASVRAEVVDDLKRIDTYLSSWAAFDEWLRLRDAA